MNQKTLFSIWAVLFAVCAALGFVPEPAGLARVALTALALVFFLPPAVLLYQANKARDHRTVCLIRNLSAIWLAVTTVVLVCNVLSLLGSEFAGDFLHALLVIVSSPMICGGSWAMTLFCWACLMFSAIQILKNMKTRT